MCKCWYIGISLWVDTIGIQKFSFHLLELSALDHNYLVSKPSSQNDSEFQRNEQVQSRLDSVRNEWYSLDHTRLEEIPSYKHAYAYKTSVANSEYNNE